MFLYWEEPKVEPLRPQDMFCLIWPICYVSTRINNRKNISRHFDQRESCVITFQSLSHCSCFPRGKLSCCLHKFRKYIEHRVRKITSTLNAPPQSTTNLNESAWIYIYFSTECWIFSWIVKFYCWKMTMKIFVKSKKVLQSHQKHSKKSEQIHKLFSSLSAEVARIKSYEFLSKQKSDEKSLFIQFPCRPTTSISILITFMRS